MATCAGLAEISTDRALGALYGLAIGDALGMPTQELDGPTAKRILGTPPDFRDGPAPPTAPPCGSRRLESRPRLNRSIDSSPRWFRRTLSPTTLTSPTLGPRPWPPSCPPA